MAFIALNLRALLKPYGFLKVIEVVLGVICLCLWRWRYYKVIGSYRTINLGTARDADYFAVVCIGGFLIYSCVMMICHVLDQASFKTLVECLMNFFGCFFYLVLGSLAIDKNEYYQDNIQEMSFGGICLILCVIYLIDCVIAFRAKSISTAAA